MLRYSEEKLESERAISSLYAKVDSELTRRHELYERVTRKIDESDIASFSDEDIKIPLERYISVVATGYFGGKAPKYKVHAFNKDVASICEKLFEHKRNDEKSLEEIEQIITHITDYNDDEAHHLKMTWDFLTKRACYEIYYKNEYGEYVYTNADALETVAIWDYSLPKNLIGLYRIIKTVMANGEYQTMVELTTKNGKRYYQDTPEKRKLFATPEDYQAKYGDEPLFTEDKSKAQPTKWFDDVPFTAIEQEDNLSIFEQVISLIQAYERVVQNQRNTHKYNDEAKFVLKGYEPENSKTITDSNGNVIINPAREKEDEYNKQQTMIYLQEGGEAYWVTKDVNDGAVENHKKTIMDLICLCSFVPNMTDLGFTQADNNSALEKKFFNLQQLVSTFKGEFKKAYTRRWEVILNKINLDKKTEYDFRDIEVILNTNLPTDMSAETSRALSLREILSTETIINMLPDDFDAINEIEKKKQEAETNLEDNQKLMQQFSQNSESIEGEANGNKDDNNLDKKANEEIKGKTAGEVVKASQNKDTEQPSAIEELDKMKK